MAYAKIHVLITPLLSDEEYYVQKGVGWALREMYNAYPRETLFYFHEHIHEITSIAFTAAMEKMKPAEKDKLKALRKEYRASTLRN